MADFELQGRIRVKDESSREFAAAAERMEAADAR